MINKKFTKEEPIYSGGKRKELNCDKITNETKDLMLSLVEKSDNENKEHAIILCDDKNGNITSTNVCVGLECEIPLKEMKKLQCPTGTEEYSDFHTHPWSKGIEYEPLGGIKPTREDIVSSASANHSSLCLGYSKVGSHIQIKDKWIERRTHIVKCYDIIDKKLLDLGNEAQQLAKRGNKRQAMKKLPLMFDRLDELSYPHKRSSTIITKCKFTKTKDYKLG